MPRRARNPNHQDPYFAWTHVMDDALVDGYLHQAMIGNRVGKTFTSQALRNIVNELKEKFPDKPIDKDKIQNRVKTIKKLFLRCHDIFKNEISGFTWDPVQEMWTAQPDVWQRLIEVKPEAAEFMYKCVRNYEKLVQLYGQDAAFEQHAETPLKTKQKSNTKQNKSSDPTSVNTIDGIDFMLHQNEVILKSVDEHENIEGPENEGEDEASPEVARSQAHSEAPSSSRAKKLKKTDTDNGGPSLAQAMELVASAIIQSTNTMMQATKTLVSAIREKDSIEDCDAWTLLVDLGFKPPFLLDAYVFLVEKPKLLEAVIKCPSEHRKSVLMKLLARQNGRLSRD